MKNEYEVRGDVTAIFLEYRGIMKETIIDTADLQKAKEHKGKWSAWWCVKTQSYYARGCLMLGNGKQKTLHLHRWLMDTPKHLQVDHINHDTLNNRRSCNLRNVTQFENQQNRNGASSKNKDGIRGVAWSKQKNKWRARIVLNKKEKHLGYFDNRAEAESIVKYARSKLMPFSTESLESVDNSGYVEEKNKPNSDNKSTGIKNVHYDNETNKYRVRFYNNKKVYFMKRYSTIQEAILVAEEVRKKMYIDAQ